MTTSYAKRHGKCMVVFPHALFFVYAIQFCVRANRVRSRISATKA